MQDQDKWQKIRQAFLQLWKAILGRDDTPVRLSESVGSLAENTEGNTEDPQSSTEERNVGEIVNLRGLQPIASMQTSTLTWSVPKIGTDEDHNEDCVGAKFDSDAVKLRAVICDGASSTWYSGQWAQILVERFTCSFDETPFDWSDTTAWEEGLAECRQLWQAALPEVQHKLAYLNELAEEKRKTGAGACLVVLECDLTNNTWRAIAYGNSILVQVRSDEVLLCGPLNEAEAFDSYTPLISTVIDSSQPELFLWRHCGGFTAGDEFFLLTDELAKWLLGDITERIELLRKQTSQSAAEDFIAQIRGEGEVHDDDMSAIHVVIGGITA